MLILVQYFRAAIRKVEDKGKSINKPMMMIIKMIITSNRNGNGIDE